MIVNRIISENERETIRIIREYTGKTGIAIVVEYAGSYGKQWHVSHSAIHVGSHFYRDRTEAIKQAQLLARY